MRTNPLLGLPLERRGLGAKCIALTPIVGAAVMESSGGFGKPRQRAVAANRLNPAGERAQQDNVGNPARVTAGLKRYFH